MLIAILRGTPIWVYVLFAWLLWNGLTQLRGREVSMRRIWVMPIIFIAWGLSAFIGRGDAGTALLPWLLAAAIGAPVGAYLAPESRIDITRRRVWQSSSVIPLVRNLLLFGAHYVLQVAAAIQPAQQITLMRWDVVVSGMGAGYFIGWAIRFLQHYRSQALADSFLIDAKI